MMDLFLKVFFFLVMIPYLILEEGIKKLNHFLEKRGRKGDVGWLHVTVVLLIVLLLIMWAEGYR